jgi:ketosteroid isomerase-like protein
MSRASAQLRAAAEAGYAALNAGDLDAFLAVTADDVEFTSLVAEAEGATFRGHEGVRAWWETIRAALQDARWEVLGVEGSADKGLACIRIAGSIGGVPLEQTMWQAVALRDGRESWWAFFRSEREALEAIELASPRD